MLCRAALALKYPADDVAAILDRVVEEHDCDSLALLLALDPSLPVPADRTR